MQEKGGNIAVMLDGKTINPGKSSEYELVYVDGEPDDILELVFLIENSEVFHKNSEYILWIIVGSGNAGNRAQLVFYYLRMIREMMRTLGGTNEIWGKIALSVGDDAERDSFIPEFEHLLEKLKLSDGFMDLRIPKAPLITCLQHAPKNIYASKPIFELLESIEDGNTPEANLAEFFKETSVYICGGFNTRCIAKAQKGRERIDKLARIFGLKFHLFETFLAIGSSSYDKSYLNHDPNSILTQHINAWGRYKFGQVRQELSAHIFDNNEWLQKCTEIGEREMEHLRNCIAQSAPISSSLYCNLKKFCEDNNADAERCLKIYQNLAEGGCFSGIMADLAFIYAVKMHPESFVPKALVFKENGYFDKEANITNSSAALVRVCDPINRAKLLEECLAETRDILSRF